MKSNISKSATEKFKTYRPQSLDVAEATVGIRRPYVDVGEFLPRLMEGFTEIVRLALHSTTGDVISIRAARKGEEYEIQIVNEYEQEFLSFRNRYPDIPTQGEILNIITDMEWELSDESKMPVWLFIAELNEYTTLAEITEFIYVDSNLYPHLNILFKEYCRTQGFN